MSHSLASRFQMVVDQLAQGNKKQFALLTGKSVSHIYKICRGLSRPSMAYLQTLYDEFKVDLNWLLTGEQGKGQQAGVLPNSELVYAPLFDVQASAGGGAAVLSEAVTENFAFNKQWLSSTLRVSSDSIAFVTVNGESMEPTLDDGDLILVDMSHQQVHREGIFLLQNDDGLFAKRLKQTRDGGLQVISDNSEFPSWTISPADYEHHRVVGKVVWCGRKM